MDWKSMVAKIAPVLGSALGGPLGGAAVSAIASATASKFLSLKYGAAKSEQP